LRPPSTSTPFPYTTLFRSADRCAQQLERARLGHARRHVHRFVARHVLTDAVDREKAPLTRKVQTEESAQHRIRDVEDARVSALRSEEHTSELQSRENIVCR